MPEAPIAIGAELTCGAGARAGSFCSLAGTTSLSNALVIRVPGIRKEPCLRASGLAPAEGRLSFPAAAAARFPGRNALLPPCESAETSAGDTTPTSFWTRMFTKSAPPEIRSRRAVSSPRTAPSAPSAKARSWASSCSANAPGFSCDDPIPKSARAASRRSASSPGVAPPSLACANDALQGLRKRRLYCSSCRLACRLACRRGTYRKRLRVGPGSRLKGGFLQSLAQKIEIS